MVVVAQFDGKRWALGALCGHPNHRWAWLVNIDNKNDQCRLSVRSEHYFGPKEIKRG